MNTKTTLTVAATTAVFLCACSPKLGEEAQQVRSNYVLSCSQSAKLSANGRLNDLEAQMLCECTHDTAMKMFGSEAEWLSAIKAYESTGRNFEFEQKHQTATQRCVKGQQKSSFSWKIKYYFRKIFG